jgi:hypothetical protein
MQELDKDPTDQVVVQDEYFLVWPFLVAKK